MKTILQSCLFIFKYFILVCQMYSLRLQSPSCLVYILWYLYAILCYDNLNTKILETHVLFYVWKIIDTSNEKLSSEINFHLLLLFHSFISIQIHAIPMHNPVWRLAFGLNLALHQFKYICLCLVPPLELSSRSKISWELNVHNKYFF